MIAPPLGLKKDAACSTTAPLDASSSTLSAVAWSVQGQEREEREGMEREERERM